MWRRFNKFLGGLTNVKVFINENATLCTTITPFYGKGTSQISCSFDIHIGVPPTCLWCQLEWACSSWPISPWTLRQHDEPPSRSQWTTILMWVPQDVHSNRLSYWVLPRVAFELDPTYYYYNSMPYNNYH